MNSSMRVRLLLIASVCAAVLSAGAVAVQADSVATNGGASDVTSTSAVLNGTVHTSDPDSAWWFEYGRTTAYSSATKVVLVGAVDSPVSAQITGLAPDTTYHFELAVEQDISASIPNAFTSSDVSFKTLPAAPGGKPPGGKPPTGGATYGKTSLKSRRLKVADGIVAVRFGCSGRATALCKGKVSVSARGKLGGKQKTVACGSATFSSSGGLSKTVTGRLSSGCSTLLKSARHHKLSATLRARFSTHQVSLKTSVTLVG